MGEKKAVGRRRLVAVLVVACGRVGGVAKRVVGVYDGAGECGEIRHFRFGCSCGVRVTYHAGYLSAAEGA